MRFEVRWRRPASPVVLRSSGKEADRPGIIRRSAEEMRVLRQGLFVTLHHGEVEIQYDVQTTTGYHIDEFRQFDVGRRRDQRA